MFINNLESGNYILQRIKMIFSRLFTHIDTSITKKNNNIYLNVIIIYNHRKHICILKLTNIINKNIADQYIENLVFKIEDKLNLH